MTTDNTNAQNNALLRLAQARLSIPALSKDTQGHGYKYVTLDSIQAAINPVLHQHGLMLMDSMVYTSHEQLVLRTIIVDLETGSILNSTEFPISEDIQYGEDKNGNPRLCVGGPQDIGSSRTYAARYNRATLLDLRLVGEDDDAASVHKKDAPKAPTNTSADGGLNW